MTVSYRKMDTLRACITDKDIFMYIVGQTPKHASIEVNRRQAEILMNCESISRDEFENNIPTSTADESLFKALYLVSIKS